MPSRIVEIQGATATVDVLGARRKANLSLLPEGASVGDYVLVHAGFALQKVERELIDSGEAMHEAGIARSVLEIVEEQCLSRGCSAVKRVTVRLGNAAGVTAEALRFSFDALKATTAAREAELVFERVPVSGRCRACGSDFAEPEERYVLVCPTCGSTSLEYTTGREMEVAELELEE